MATPPTFPDSADLAEGTGNRSFASVSTTAGDYLVVEVIGEDAALANVTPSHASLSFAKQNDAGAASHVRVQHWTAQDATGGSRVIDMTASVGGRNWRARLTVVRGSGGVGTGKGVNTTAQTVSVTRQQDNSAMFMSVGDWDVGAVGSPAWTPGGSTTASQQGSAATYIFGRWDDSGGTATASHGISSPSYTTPSAAVLEMLGIAGAAGGAGVPTPSLPPYLVLRLAAWAKSREQAGSGVAPTPETGSGTAGSAGSGTGVKVAAQTGFCSTGSVGSAVQVRAAAGTGNSSTGTVGSGTARKVAPNTGSGFCGAVGAGVQQKVQPNASTASAGVVGAGSGRKLAPNAGHAAAGSVAEGTGVRKAAVTALAAVGASGSGSGTSGTPAAAQTGHLYVGSAGVGAAAKVAAGAGCVTAGSVGHGQSGITPQGTAVLVTNTTANVLGSATTQTLLATATALGPLTSNTTQAPLTTYTEVT